MFRTPPVRLSGTVVSIDEKTVVVKVGSVQAIVTKDRNRNTNFSNLDLDPLATDIIRCWFDSDLVIALRNIYF